MDDSFAYRTTVPIHRRVDPRLIRAAMGSLAVLAAIALFATWVIASERRSFDRPSPAVAASGPAPAGAPVASVPEPNATDADVDGALALAADAAREVLALEGTFLAATPARLAQLQAGYTFVDGPSTTASVVSIASTRDTWAAAVLGPDGACAWTTVSADGGVVRAAGVECTGAAALTSFTAR